MREREAARRAIEVAHWAIDRHWPVGRLKEAWVVARHGAGEAALRGGRAAGPLARERAGDGWERRGRRDDYLALRRAVARYERNHAAAPDGFPAGGLAALLHIGVLARESGERDGPMYLAYAIGALDQLSRRMRALNTADSAQRNARKVARAKARHATPNGNWPLAFRAGGWPSWVVLDAHGVPEVRLNDRFEDALVTRLHGPPSPGIEREVLRDALLVRNGSLPPELDGPAAMVLRARGELPPAERRNDTPVSELARLTGLPARQLAKFPPEQLAVMLQRARAGQRRDQRRARDRREMEQPE